MKLIRESILRLVFYKGEWLSDVYPGTLNNALEDALEGARRLNVYSLSDPNLLPIICIHF